MSDVNTVMTKAQGRNKHEGGLTKVDTVHWK